MMKNLAVSTLRTAACIAVTSLVAAPLGACSGGSTALPTSPKASAAAPAVKESKTSALLYIADSANEVAVFDAATTVQNPPPIRTIKNGISLPAGISTDRSGNLYVSNEDSNSVTEYAPNSGKPKFTITDGVSEPVDVKVDGFQNVYVANSPGGTTSGYIDLYALGASQPSFTWTLPVSGSSITAIALLNPLNEGETSVYAAANVTSPSAPLYAEIFACRPKKARCVALSQYSIKQAGGLAVVESPDEKKAFEFLACDLSLPGIDTFVAGKLTNQLIDEAGPTFIALNAKENVLYASANNVGAVTAYTLGGTVLNTFESLNGAPSGVATYPAGTYH
jgi:hypothetical protein